jgi:hypothetical protein
VKSKAEENAENADARQTGVIAFALAGRNAICIGIAIVNPLVGSNL